MNNERDTDELLRRILTGELSELDSEVEAALAADPELSLRLEALRETQGQLDAQATRERVLEEARAEAWAEGEERVGETLSEFLLQTELASAAVAETGTPGSSAPTATRRRPLGWLGAFLAVAAAIMIVDRLLVSEVDPGLATERQVYLGEELPGAMPAGEVDGYAPFRWSYELAPGDSFELAVYDDTAEATSAPLVRVSRLTGNSWESPAESSEWPDAIRWTLDLVRPDGARVEGFTTRAWRSLR